jgi:hypothetical protein
VLPAIEFAGRNLPEHPLKTVAALKNNFRI